MNVTFYGTRGSIPVSGFWSNEYGGNTTSLRITSECLPSGNALAVDAGSGFVPLSRGLLGNHIERINLLFTHFHHDHTMGLPLAPHTFIPSARINIWGPKEHGVGPLEVFKTIMCPPYFPVDFAMVQSRFYCHGLENIGTQVMVVHPKGGFLLVKMDVFERTEREREREGNQLSFGKNGRHAIDECLVIKMYKTRHPEYTVSYRFEERPTDRVFVFLTDHEKTAGFPLEFVRHLQDADLLVQDAQYSEEQYHKDKAGFGHGTPEYCVDTAIAAGAKTLGLTHHDPAATKLVIESRLQAAKEHAAKQLRHDLAEHIFACADGQTMTVI